MKRFWVSFYMLPKEGDKQTDYRPLKFPPGAGILGYWSSGFRWHDYAETVCIFVEAESEEKARELLKKDWPETALPETEWRFFQDCPSDWLPSDRFPLADWSQERIGVGKANESR